MQITGKLELDPRVLAVGKDRTRIIRRHSQMIASCVRPYVPHLEGHARRRANTFDQLLVDDPNYWIRRKGPVSESYKLENLLAHARDVLKTQEEYPEIRKLLRNAIKQVDEGLVLTRQDKGWAILRVNPKHVISHLQGIRADGTRISFSAWGPHISVVRGEVRRWTNSQKVAHDGKEFTVEVSDVVRKNRKGYYWLDVQSSELENLRLKLGLPPRPSPPFHLTIGKQC